MPILTDTDLFNYIAQLDMNNPAHVWHYRAVVTWWELVGVSFQTLPPTPKDSGSSFLRR